MSGEPMPISSKIRCSSRNAIASPPPTNPLGSKSLNVSCRPITILGPTRPRYIRQNPRARRVLSRLLTGTHAHPAPAAIAAATKFTVNSGTTVVPPRPPATQPLPFTGASPMP